MQNRILLKPQCKQWVYGGSRFDCSEHQCARKPILDGFCKQHHPDAIAKRAEESKRRYDDKWDNSVEMKLIRATNKLEKAEQALAQLKEMVDHPSGIYHKDWEFLCTVIGAYHAK